ncbi:MAG: ABC transporter substrate-binding protein [Betaproteobacteria bacterium]|nr:ABC transporter substrate-binding protein [Betaproteobacteria bacterium]
MSDKNLLETKISRRGVIKAAAAAGVVQLAAPFIGSARAAEPVKIGLCNPLTGTYAAVGKNELIGCQLAIEQINAKGGIIGRPVTLLVEDSTSGDAGTAVQKSRKLIERDNVNFLLGNVNSALALAMAQVSNEKGVVHIVPGGHTDAITGASCHWNVFRVCNTTQMEAYAVAPELLKKGGKKWYFITPDYAFGHTLQAGLEKAAAKIGAVKVGGDLTPLGATDFSSYLIKAQAAKPDVIIFLPQGNDMINCIKQAVQFGLDKRFHLAGAQQELEALEGLPPEARIGTWVFEWYWNQPGVPHVAEFVAAIKKKTGRVPTARTWFGFASAWSCALAANQAKSLDAHKVAKALQGLKLPPEVALMPEQPFFRAGQNQLIPTLYVGNAQAKGSAGEDDLFHVTEIVKGSEVAGTVEESGCKMVWPS